jgi:hypothetical protein
MVVRLKRVGVPLAALIGVVLLWRGLLVLAEEFNPLGIVVPPTGRQVHVVRFWRAFREHKHGKEGLLRTAEADIDKCLGAAGGV